MFRAGLLDIIRKYYYLCTAVGIRYVDWLLAERSESKFLCWRKYPHRVFVSALNTSFPVSTISNSQQPVNINA